MQQDLYATARIESRQGPLHRKEFIDYLKETTTSIWSASPLRDETKDRRIVHAPTIAIQPKFVTVDESVLM